MTSGTPARPGPGTSVAGNDTETRVEYEQFRELLERMAGISLGDNKSYLVQSRLRGILAENGVANVGELVRRIQREPGSPLRQQTVDAMTTNETQWFRDVHPYTALSERILPELAARKPARVRVWSAGCSSGQEPYSIAILFDEYRLLNPGRLMSDLEIIGTDISTRMLALSRDGIYDEMAVTRGLSETRRKRYFLPVNGGWQVRDEVRRRVSFRALNLLDSFVPLGRFDLVFCRNVLIYFAQERKADILTRMAGTLNSGGYLVLGASEALAGASELFDLERHGSAVLYRKR